MSLTRKALSLVLGMAVVALSPGLPEHAAAQQATITLKKADYTPLSNSRAAVSKWWADEKSAQSVLMELIKLLYYRVVH
jgi:TRAP-type C4-dicarboxylate transport system substrate-binding protein